MHSLANLIQEMCALPSESDVDGHEFATEVRRAAESIEHLHEILEQEGRDKQIIVKRMRKLEDALKEVGRFSPTHTEMNGQRFVSLRDLESIQNHARKALEEEIPF